MVVVYCFTKQSQHFLFWDSVLCWQSLTRFSLSLSLSLNSSRKVGIFGYRLCLPWAETEISRHTQMLNPIRLWKSQKAVSCLALSGTSDKTFLDHSPLNIRWYGCLPPVRLRKCRADSQSQCGSQRPREERGWPNSWQKTVRGRTRLWSQQSCLGLHYVFRGPGHFCLWGPLLPLNNIQN